MKRAKQGGPEQVKSRARPNARPVPCTGWAMTHSILARVGSDPAQSRSGQVGA